MKKVFSTFFKKLTILSLICALIMALTSCAQILDQLVGETEEHIDLSNGVITAQRFIDKV